MTTRKKAKLDLHGLLRRNAYDHAVITTFEFSAPFFEGYCLEKLKALSHNPNINIIVDRQVYNTLLLERAGQRPEKANLRYLLHPITLPGRFHPKVFLFASKHKGLLIVGSANFTRNGLTSNAELVRAFTYDAEEDPETRQIFMNAFIFIQRICGQWGCSDLNSNLMAMAREAPWLIASDGEKVLELPIRFLHNLDEPLWSQMVRMLQGRKVKTVRVLSRFFSPKCAILDAVHDDLRPEDLVIYTQNGVTNLDSNWLDHASIKRKKTKILLCSYQDNDHPQVLHAKAFAFECTTGKWDLAFGSANFTRSALLSKAESGNLEVLITVPDLSAAKVNAQRLFDPGNNGVLLTKKDQLLTAQNSEPVASAGSYALCLEEASLENGRLVLSVQLDDASAIRAELRFYDDARSRLSLSKKQGKWGAELSDDVLVRFERYSTIVQLIDVKDRPISNPVLLLNLQDMRTGQSVRKERHVREAIESAVQFSRVLSDLLDGGDDAALLNFLTLCDIPFCGSSRAPTFPGGRPAWSGVGHLKALGARNLRVFDNIHDAAVAFIERHFKRLERHCQDPELDSVANYMHIAVGISGVVRAQIERAIAGLEAEKEPMDPDAWYRMRIQLSRYTLLFGQALELTACEYLPKLVKYYAKQKVRNEIQPEMASIMEAFESVIGIRRRLDACIKDNLRVRTPDGTVPPPFSNVDQFIESRWLSFCERIQYWKERILHFAA